jgi:hypothetical protein
MKPKYKRVFRGYIRNCDIEKKGHPMIGNFMQITLWSRQLHCGIIPYRKVKITVEEE